MKRMGVRCFEEVKMNVSVLGQRELTTGSIARGTWSRDSVSERLEYLYGEKEGRLETNWMKEMRLPLPWRNGSTLFPSM